MTNAIAIPGLNLIAGQAGLISLGHGAFYGLGAHAVAVLMRHAGMSAYAGIAAAGLVCLATGYLFGRMVARLAGFYLALSTFALALAMPQMLKSRYVSAWTGGAQGLYLDRPSAPLGLPLDPGATADRRQRPALTANAAALSRDGPRGRLRHATHGIRGTIRHAMEARADANAVAEAVNRLVDEYRIRCLWFLRPDYYPSTREERLRVLGHIERHGDRDAFRRAAALRRWLSPDSSAPSAGC